MEKEGVWRRWGISLMAIFIAVTAGFGIYYYQMAMRLKVDVENGYERAFSQLYADAEGLRNALSKAMVTSDKEELLRLSEEIYLMADGAKQNLGYLPISEDALDATETFLAQVGNYTSFLAHRHMDGTSVTQEESDTLHRLYDYSHKMEEELFRLQGKLESGEILLWDGGNRRTKATTLAQSYQDLEQSFSDYAALSYDAPFSAHLLNPLPVAHEGEKEVSMKEAMASAESILGNRATDLSYTGEGGGSLPAYLFSGTVGEGRRISAKITRAGGHLLWFLDSRTVMEPKLKTEEAIEYAKAFARDLGMGETEPSFYETAAGSVTVFLTPLQEGVLLYPDAVSVRVALDNGEILGADATAYRMNHRERDLSGIQISPEEAKNAIRPSARLSGGHTVLFVPLSGKETLAYEWKAQMGEDSFLVYVNASNGRIEDVRHLSEGEDRRMVDER